MNNSDNQVPVLIVGGGVVGLSAALFLLYHDVPVLLIEKHKGTSIHPRARGFDVRTMELYRQLQISEKIREAGKALQPAWGIYTNKSLAAALQKVKTGKKKTPNNLFGVPALAMMSPETGARCTQDLSEPVLLQTARERGGDIRFYTELVRFTQNDKKVIATVRDRETGAETVIEATYMIAADGAKSTVREILQADTIGRGAIGNLLNIYFEADLKEFVKGREFSILLIKEPDLKGMLTSINNNDRWVFHLHYDPAKGEQPGDFTTERLTGTLQRIIGLPDLPIRIISVLLWQPTVKVVKNMQQGRIFLAGDAAHVMTPYGGKGANTGIQDAHNLAWKLATVLKDKAPASFLKTYSAERQPIGWHNSVQSGAWADEYGLLSKKFSNIFGLIGTMIPAVLASKLGLVKLSHQLSMRRLAGMLGLPDYKYDASTATYQKAASLTAEPGTRMPHFWVQQNGNRLSTLDVLGKEWVLFTRTDNNAWKEAANELNSKLQLLLTVYSIGVDGDLVYKEQELSTVCGISSKGAILVRPDGFVAWRSVDECKEPVVSLSKIFYR